MTTHPLPPQAYTKDTLQKAYTWLLNQSPSIKELATTQDLLVSLYLKAQRNGDAVLQAPSIQNFKQELKSLAGIIGELQPTAHSLAQPQPVIQQAEPQNASVFSTSFTVDPSTAAALAEIRATLNLSSDSEALRALVALGYKAFKKI